MADWTRRFDAAYRFVRVSRATGYETGLLDGFKAGGSIERNLDTAVKESGSVEHVGDLDIGADLVRIYLDAAFPDGSTESAALGTFLASSTSRKTDGSASSRTVSLAGRLKELEDAEFVTPFCVPAGTNLVTYAAGIVRDAGLDVRSDASAYASTEPLYYGVQPQGTDASSSDSTKLAVVNDLLDRAGFDSARTDAYGTVVLSRSADVASRPVAWSFEEGPYARFLRDATDEFDTSEIANSVYAVFTGAAEEGGEQVTTIGHAVDSDPDSPWSTASMGREVTARYEYQRYSTQADADVKAAELLAQQRSVARKVTISHVYAPVTIGDAVRIAYASGGIDGTFSVRTQRIEMGPGCLTEMEARANVRS